MEKSKLTHKNIIISVGQYFLIIVLFILIANNNKVIRNVLLSLGVACDPARYLATTVIR